MKEILIVLGSPNSDQGILEEIAVNRLNYCADIFDSKTNLVLCTGGFGEKFNTTNQPHAKYAMQYLMQAGIEEKYFMTMALSSNTVDDAVKTREILSGFLCTLKIITSAYHLERTRLIFDQILIDIPKLYIGVSHEFDENIESNLRHHERKAIDEIKKNGLYF